ncbi:DNA repair protein RadC [Caenispirillum salinarum]|uniref:RadC family protein n=1 Tax=Caenispirillum salinarum TaxID=859058 RepID=UPI00384D89B7
MGDAGDDRNDAVADMFGHGPPASGGLAEEPASPPAPAAKDNHKHGHRERLRDRFLKGGAESVADYELLELMLFAAIPRRDVKPIAKELLKRFKTVGNVVTARPEELMQVDGIKLAAATALKSAEAVAVRMLRDQVMDRPVISSWDSLIDYCTASMAYRDTEQFRILFLDRRNRLIADELQQKGTVDHTPVYPREVLKRALEVQASALILVHNHPSGDPTPSQADIQMTRTIRDAARPLGVTLHDHVIVGRGSYTSLKAQGFI